MSKKNLEVPSTRNFVAKHAGMNRASTHVDLKKQHPRKLKNNQIDY